MCVSHVDSHVGVATGAEGCGEGALRIIEGGYMGGKGSDGSGLLSQARQEDVAAHHAS